MTKITKPVPNQVVIWFGGGSVDRTLSFAGFGGGSVDRTLSFAGSVEPHRTSKFGQTDPNPEQFGRSLCRSPLNLPKGKMAL